MGPHEQINGGQAGGRPPPYVALLYTLEDTDCSSVLTHTVCWWENVHQRIVWNLLMYTEGYDIVLRLICRI